MHHTPRTLNTHCSISGLARFGAALLAALAAIALLTGCTQPVNSSPTLTPSAIAISVTAPATLPPAATATRLPTDTPTPEPTSTHSPVPTATPTWTRTATTTPSPTPAATRTRVPTRPPTTAPTTPPEATAASTAPPGGRYPQTGCGRIVATDAFVSVCLVWVQVHPDRMEFGMTWQAISTLNGMWGRKLSDASSRDIYLIDEFGQRYYDMDEVTGAGGEMSMLLNVVYEGSLFFPLPANGARRFDYIDERSRGKPPFYPLFTAVLP